MGPIFWSGHLSGPEEAPRKERSVALEEGGVLDSLIAAADQQAAQHKEDIHSRATLNRALEPPLLFQLDIDLRVKDSSWWLMSFFNFANEQSLTFYWQ